MADFLDGDWERVAHPNKHPVAIPLSIVSLSDLTPLLLGASGGVQRPSLDRTLNVHCWHLGTTTSEHLAGALKNGALELGTFNSDFTSEKCWDIASESKLRTRMHMSLFK